MLSLLVATALAQQPLTVPLGRAAVLAPQQAPTELTIDKPSVIDVQPVMPWLIVVGKSVGETDLRMAHADGTLTWAVTVSADAPAPTGAMVLDQPTRQVAVAVGCPTAALRCSTPPPGPRAGSSAAAHGWPSRRPPRRQEPYACEAREQGPPGWSRATPTAMSRCARS